MIIAEQLSLLKDAVSKEIDGVRKNPVSRFYEVHLRAGAQQ